MAAQAVTRSFALTGRPCDLSTMVGYVGQGCWTHDYSGKANAYRPRTRAGLYICPAEECSGQLFFDLRSYTLQVVQAVSFPSSPDRCWASSRTPACMPRTGPSPSRRRTSTRPDCVVSSTPEDDLDTAVVITNPLTGLPESIVHYIPLVVDDGSIVMHPRDPASTPA